MGTTVKARRYSERHFSFALPAWYSGYVHLRDETAIEHLADILVAGQLESISIGPDCVMKLTRRLSAPVTFQKRWIGMPELIRRFRAYGGSRYFESLDDAFVGAPEARDGCAWVGVRDIFNLSNLGTLSEDPSSSMSSAYRAMARSILEEEQRLVFEQPILDTYSYQDNYFKRRKRPWRSTMVLPCCRFCGLKPPRFNKWPEISCYFMRSKGVVVLNVLGAYFRTGLDVNIVPFAVFNSFEP